MLKVYHSNRLEQLAIYMAATIQVEPLQSVLAPEVIVTQHQGMARWLSMQLAQVQGISANCDYPLPASYIWKLYRSQLDNVPESSLFDRSILTWRLMDCLPRLLDEPEFTPLKHYLKSGREQLKQYQLCRYIADTFEQYLIYRPEWIHAWQRGEDSGCEKQPWQSRLWRAVVGDTPPVHRASLHQQFMQRAALDKIDPQKLPQRLMVFGINNLPPSYLDVLAAVAKKSTFTSSHSTLAWPSGKISAPPKRSPDCANCGKNRANQTALKCMKWATRYSPPWASRGVIFNA